MYVGQGNVARGKVRAGNAKLFREGGSG